MVPDDDHIIYTFHFYKPHLFTHQKARWSPVTREYDQELHYPGEFPGLAQFLEAHPDHLGIERDHPPFMNRDLLARLIGPAAEFLRTTRKPLYCGEFGVIDHAPMASRIAWHRDFVDLLRQLGIGGAVWSYKQMNLASRWTPATWSTTS